LPGTPQKKNEKGRADHGGDHTGRDFALFREHPRQKVTQNHVGPSAQYTCRDQEPMIRAKDKPQKMGYHQPYKS